MTSLEEENARMVKERRNIQRDNTPSLREELDRQRGEDRARENEERRYARSLSKKQDEDVEPKQTRRNKHYNKFVDIFWNVVGCSAVIGGIYIGMYNYVNKRLQKVDDYKLINSYNRDIVREKLYNNLSRVELVLDRSRLTYLNKKLLENRIDHTKVFLRTAPSSVNNEECIKKYIRIISNIRDIYNLEQSKRQFSK